MRRRGYLKAPQVASDGHDEFLKKCRFVRDLLIAQQIPACSADDAAAWTLTFADEGDPTFPIIDWLEAGWRDPLLVDAALRICGTLDRAEACMRRLDRDVGSQYDHSIIRALAETMLDLKNPPNDS